MLQSFISCDRGQVFLMPPSLVDRVPDDHLVWTVLGAVDQVDLEAFYGSYRANGQGRAAYDPKMMAGLLIYAYSRGTRSSRGIERECREDVVCKLISALRVPDRSTIAEFRRRHETALAAVFSQVLGLCWEAGLVKVGVIAVDGTKVHANASKERNVEYQRLVWEILAEAERIDAGEDEQFGEERGDELPEELQTPAGRERALREAKQRLEREQPGDAGPPEPRQPAGERLDSSDAEGGELVLRFDAETVDRYRAGAGAGGSWRPTSNRLSTAAGRPSRCRAPARRACWRSSNGSPSSSLPSSTPTRRMRRISRSG